MVNIIHIYKLSIIKLQMQYLLSILYFLITLGFPNLYTYIMGIPNIPLFKTVNILLLASSQILLLNINPLIFSSGKTLSEHINFCLRYYLPMLVGISTIINFLPFQVGLPHLLELTIQSIISDATSRTKLDNS